MTPNRAYRIYRISRKINPKIKQRHADFVSEFDFTWEISETYFGQNTRTCFTKRSPTRAAPPKNYPNSL